MKITKDKLQEIIQEEMELLLKENSQPITQTTIKMPAREFLKLTTTDGSKYLSSNDNFEDFKKNPPPQQNLEDNSLSLVYRRYKESSDLQKGYNPKMAGILFLALDKEGNILQAISGHSGRARAFANLVNNGFEAENDVSLRCSSGDLSKIRSIKGQFDRSVEYIPKIEKKKEKSLSDFESELSNEFEKVPLGNYPVKIRRSNVEKDKLLVDPDPTSGIAGILGKLGQTFGAFGRWYNEKNKEKLDRFAIDNGEQTIAGSQLRESWVEYINTLNSIFKITDQDGKKFKVFPPLGGFMLLRIGNPEDSQGKKPQELDADLIKSYKEQPDKKLFFKLERRN